jgi:hypothetical protein
MVEMSPVFKNTTYEPDPLPILAEKRCTEEPSSVEGHTGLDHLKPLLSLSKAPKDPQPNESSSPSDEKIPEQLFWNVEEEKEESPVQRYWKISVEIGRGILGIVPKRIFTLL